MSPNQKAFLDMIAFSELGHGLLEISDNGYDIIVGSTVANPIRFSSYDDHPRRKIKLNDHLASTAAGRYQILERNFDAYKAQLHLPDFSPASQDAIALQMIKECRAFEYINFGNFEEGVKRCAHIWASLPGAGYGQHENKMDGLRQAYLDAGGYIA